MQCIAAAARLVRDDIEILACKVKVAYCRARIAHCKRMIALYERCLLYTSDAADE